MVEAPKEIKEDLQDNLQKTPEMAWREDDEEEESSSWRTKKILLYVVEAIVGIAIFVVIVRFLTRDKAPVKENMQFVFNDQSGNQVQLWSWENIKDSEWSYLFDATGTNALTQKDTWLAQVGTGLAQNDTWLMQEEVTGLTHAETGLTQVQVQYKDCITPWKSVVKHWDYTLAYQQRTDVPNICNVEKRSCNNGKLYGTFAQWSCQENFTYEYTRIQATSSQTKPQNDLIQPSKYPPNYNAQFDEKGRLISWWTNWGSDTSRNNSNTQWSQSTKPSTTQVSPSEKSPCVTPWGEVVLNGQFIKTYKEPEVSTKCETELRFCINGVLKWSFQYRTCSYVNINDTKLPDAPTADATTQWGWGIWSTFKNFFGL